MKKFIQDNTSTTTFKLEELPNSELIKDSIKLKESLNEMNSKFFLGKTSTLEIYHAMNSWFDNRLPELDKEIMENRNEQYAAG